MKRWLLRYVGHRPGADLAYFTGASVDFAVGFEIESTAHGIVVGRAASAGLRVASSEIARAHVRLTAKDDGVKVEDLRTTNGTWVNEVRIDRVLARAGDVLRLGLSFDFEILEATS